MSEPDHTRVGLRVVAGLGAAALVCNVGLAYLQRAMLGFPDGFRGPADAWAEAAYVSAMVVSAVLALGLAGIAVRRSAPTLRLVAVLACLGALAIVLCVAAEPLTRAVWPDTGG